MTERGTVGRQSGRSGGQMSSGRSRVAWLLSGLLCVNLLGARGFAEEAKESTFEDYYRRAQELYDKGRFQEATALFQRALQALDEDGRSDDGSGASPPLSSHLSGSRNRQAYAQHLREGKALLAQQHFAEAVEAFEQALRIDPTSDEAAQWLIRAREAQVAQDWSNAEAPAASKESKPSEKQTASAESATTQSAERSRQVTESQTQLAQVQAALNGKEEEVARLRQELSTTQQRLTQLTSELNATKTEQQRLLEALKTLRSQHSDATAAQQRDAAALSELKRQLQDAKQEHENLNVQLDNVKQVNQQLEERLRLSQDEADRIQERARSDAKQLGKALAQREAELTTAKQQQAVLEERLTQQLKTSEAQIAQLQQQLHQVEWNQTTREHDDHEMNELVS